MYGRASEILGWDVARLSFEGPMEKLTQTCHTQPAVLVHSYIAFRLLEERGVRPAMARGHSLGESSALVAAGAADFEAALRLVQARGRFMHEAVPSGGGAQGAPLRGRGGGGEGGRPGGGGRGGGRQLQWRGQICPLGREEGGRGRRRSGRGARDAQGGDAPGGSSLSLLAAHRGGRPDERSAGQIGRASC